MNSCPKAKVNHTVYKEILWRLVRSVRDKRRSLWEVHAWSLYHDDAPAHTALSICQFLAERNIATLEHPHIPPIWPRVTFFSSLKSNLFWKGTHYSDIDSIKMAATTELKKILENAFRECFESWKRRIHKRFQVEGNYLKKFDFGTFQYFSIKFLQHQSHYFLDTLPTTI